MRHSYIFLLFIIFELTPFAVFTDNLEKIRIENPGLKINPLIEDAQVDCTDEYITALIFLREPFSGVLYADNQSDPECSASGDGTRYNISLTLRNGECGVNRQIQSDGELELEAKYHLQFHHALQGLGDQKFRFVCTPSIFHQKAFFKQAAMFDVRRKHLERLLVRSEEEDMKFATNHHHRKTGDLSIPESKHELESSNVVNDEDKIIGEILNQEHSLENKHKLNKPDASTSHQNPDTSSFQEMAEHAVAKPKTEMNEKHKSRVVDKLKKSAVESKSITESMQEADPKTPNQVNVGPKSTVKTKLTPKRRVNMDSSLNGEQEDIVVHISTPRLRVVFKDKPVTLHTRSAEHNGTEAYNVPKPSPTRILPIRNVPVAEPAQNTEKSKKKVNPAEEISAKAENKSSTDVEFKMQVNQMTHFTPMIEFTPDVEVRSRKVTSSKGLRLMSGDHEEYIQLTSGEAEKISRMFRPELNMRIYPGFVEPPVETEITRRRVGKNLTMVITAKQYHGLDSQIINCSANDYSSAHTQLLVNMDGCSVNEKIMSNLKETYNTETMEKIFYSHFRAFKFPHHDKILISCALRFCKGLCEKPNCKGTKPMPNSNVTFGTYELDPKESQMSDGFQISMLSNENDDEEISDEIIDDEAIQDYPGALKQMMPKGTITSGNPEESDDDPPTQLTAEEELFCINFVRFACCMLFLVLVLLVSLVVTICMCVSAKELKKRLKNMSSKGYGRMT